jgi:hypothetical protein
MSRTLAPLFHLSKVADCGGDSGGGGGGGVWCGETSNILLSISMTQNLSRKVQYIKKEKEAYLLTVSTARSPSPFFLPQNPSPKSTGSMLVYLVQYTALLVVQVQIRSDQIPKLLQAF